MRREQLNDLLDDGKATNGDSPDFMITVPDSETRSVLTLLRHLVAKGTITSFDQRNPPDDNCFDIVGYNG